MPDTADNRPIHFYKLKAYKDLICSPFHSKDPISNSP